VAHLTSSRSDNFPPFQLTALTSPYSTIKWYYFAAANYESQQYALVEFSRTAYWLRFPAYASKTG